MSEFTPLYVSNRLHALIEIRPDGRWVSHEAGSRLYEVWTTR